MYRGNLPAQWPYKDIQALYFVSKHTHSYNMEHGAAAAPGTAVRTPAAGTGDGTAGALQMTEWGCTACTCLEE